jgi:hypothetical protein
MWPLEIVSQMMFADFVDWLDGYGKAWTTGDPDAVVALFSNNAAYHETPFDAPLVGTERIHQYWANGARDSQRSVMFKSTPLFMDVDTGCAWWKATFFRVPSDLFVELDGILSARFDETRRCVEFREWWHRRESYPARESPIPKDALTALRRAHLRIARPTDDFAPVVQFYRDGLGFEVLSEFKDHDGFDGVMLGHKKAAYHLEFTRKQGHKAGKSPSEEHLLVFYLPDATEWNQAIARLERLGYKPVRAFNSYWDRMGKTFADPDEYRVVLQNAAWPA